MDNLIVLTKGYSGADLHNLCQEASMLPLRDVKDIRNINPDDLRAIVMSDFIKAINQTKDSVCENDLK